MTKSPEQPASDRSLLEDIIGSIPVRIFWKDRDSRFAGCNALFAADAGFSRPDDVIGKTDFDMPWKSQAKRYRTDDIHIMESGLPRLGFDQPNITASGRTVWLHTSKAPLFDQEGNVTGILGISEDITAQKAVEEMHRASEARFRALFEQSPLGIQLVASDGRTLAVNRAWEALWGVPFEALSDYNLFEDRQLIDKGVMPKIREALAGKHVLVPALEYDRAATPEVFCQGGRVWVRTFIAPLMNEDGTLREIMLVHEDVSERREMEQALAEKQQQHEMAQQIAQLGHWTLDLVDNRLIWSDEVCRIFGMQPGENGSYESFLARVHPDDVDFVHRAYTDSVENRSPYDIEHRLLLADGSVKWVHERCKTWYADDGTPLRSIGTVLDITGHKQAEAELQRFRRLVDESNDAVFVIDTGSAAFLDVNKMACASLGYSREELLQLGATDIEAALPELFSWEKYARGMQRAGSMLMEGRYRRKDGSTFPVEVNISYVAGQERDHMIAIARDVSDRRRAQEKLLESKSRFEALFNAVTDAVFVHEIGEDGSFGKFLEVNEVACRHLGYTYEELLARSPADIDAPDSDADLEAVVRRLFAGESASFEQIHVARDGRRIPVEIHTQMFSFRGRPAVISLVRNISERRKAEEELRRFEHIVSTSADMLALLDRNFTYLAANPAYLTAWAKTREELVGHAAVEVVGREFFESVMRPHALSCLAGETVNFQAWYEYPACEPRYMDFNYYPYADAGGEVTGFVVNARNITDRHQAEESLAGSYRMLDAVSRAQSKFISDTRPNVLFDELLSVILEVTGCEYGYIGQILYTDDRRPYLKNFATTDISWNEETREYYRRHADSGLEFHNLQSLFGEVITSGEPVISNDPANDPRGCGIPAGHPPLNAFLGLPVHSGEQLIGMIGLANMPGGFSETVVEFLRPLTASCAQIIAACRNDQKRRQAVESMRRSEEKFRSLFESASDGILIVDLEGNLIDFNSVAHERLGYSKAEMLNMHITEVDAPEAAARVPERISMIRQQGHARFESVHQKRDGTRMPVEINARVIDFEGRKALLSVIRDISERKQAERELRQAMHMLGERVKELRCLHSLAGLAESDTGSMDEYLQQAVRLIPPALQYPEAACARITFRDREFHTENFRSSQICLSGPIIIQGEEAGRVDVCYLERLPEMDTDPFLAEEADLVEAIAAHLGRTILHKRTDRQLRESERKFRNLAEELRESQSRLQFIHDNAPDYIFQIQRDGTVVYVNRIPPGFTRDDVLGTNMRRWMQPEYHDAFAAAMEKAFGSRTMTEYESKGSVTGRFYSNRISPIMTDEGVEGGILVAHDISERKQAEHNLAAKDRELNTIFEYAPVIAFYKDRQGRFLRVNRLLAERLGMEEETLIGKTAFDLYSPEIARSMADDDNEVMTTGRSRLGIIEECETVLGRRWVQTEKIPIADADGRVTGLVGFSMDITERRHAEEQLRQAQKMEAVGTLVGGIAHDFNNMLAAIKANVYLARVQPKNESAVMERLANIEQVATGAAEMVQQLLAFARKDIASTSVLSLSDFMREGVKLARTIIPENIHCRVDICSEELVIRGDATQLQQVLMNLLNNARDAVAGVAVPEIGCSLAPYTADPSFRSRHAVQQDDFACWSVTDNGCGIPEDMQQKIFDPFFTTKDVGKGTGLGLAMMYSAVKGHGGVVEVESAEGKGTTFRIYLPLTGETVESTVRSREIRVKGRGETILLVDDEESVRISSRSVLEDLGYRVLEAADGEQALAAFMANRDDIDLLMTDVIMPRLNGTDLVLRVRESGSSIPVILVTGYDRGHVLDEHLQMEHCDVINKPFHFDALSRRIRQLIDSGGVRGQQA